MEPITQFYNQMSVLRYNDNLMQVAADGEFILSNISLEQTSFEVAKLVFKIYQNPCMRNDFFKNHKRLIEIGRDAREVFIVRYLDGMQNDKNYSRSFFKVLDLVSFYFTPDNLACRHNFTDALIMHTIKVFKSGCPDAVHHLLSLYRDQKADYEEFLTVQFKKAVCNEADLLNKVETIFEDSFNYTSCLMSLFGDVQRVSRIMNYDDFINGTKSLDIKVREILNKKPKGYQFSPVEQRLAQFRFGPLLRVALESYRQSHAPSLCRINIDNRIVFEKRFKEIKVSSIFVESNNLVIKLIEEFTKNKILRPSLANTILQFFNKLESQFVEEENKRAVRVSYYHRQMLAELKKN